MSAFPAGRVSDHAVHGLYSKAAIERAMKIQDVLLRAIARKITWFPAAEILGFSDGICAAFGNAMGSLVRTGYSIGGEANCHPNAVPLATVEAMLGLYRDRCFDLNVRHFHEKLKTEHQIDLGYSWVKSALQGAGLVARARRRGVHRKRRERRPLPGAVAHRWQPASAVSRRAPVGKKEFLTLRLHPLVSS